MEVLFPFLGFAGGVVMLVMGLLKRGRAQAWRQIPCRPVNALEGGERQFMTGKAHSPVSLTAPVSKAACVFYRERVERRQQNYSNRHSYWVTEADNARGGFYVNDGTGAALVVPRAAGLDLSKPEIEESDGLPLPGGNPGEVRRTELIISENETVTVLGAPRPLGELMAYLRRYCDQSLPSDLLAELTRLELDPAAAGLRCFFGDGVERLSDQPYEVYVEGTASSGASLIQLGLVLAVVCGAFLIYLLAFAQRAAAF